MNPNTNQESIYQLDSSTESSWRLVKLYFSWFIISQKNWLSPQTAESSTALMTSLVQVLEYPAIQ